MKLLPILLPLLCVNAITFADSRKGHFFTEQFESSKIKAIENLTYGQKLNQGGELSDLLVDLFIPPKASTGEKLPLIILIHGGGFRNGTKEKNRDWAIEYATYGYAP